MSVRKTERLTNSTIFSSFYVVVSALSKVIQRQKEK